MTRKKTLLLVFMSLVAFGGCGCGLWYFLGDVIVGGTNRDRIVSEMPTTGPASRWAEPLTCEGVGNFYRVSPTLYRGEQPTKEGMKNLSKMEIKMIVSLRQYHGDSSLIGDLPLKYRRVKFNALNPSDEQVAEFLKLVSDPENQPVFVHCLHGSDRTGMMCAAYRVVFDGWSKSEAIDEWTRGGFGFHGMWKNLVRYFDKLDTRSLIPASRPADRQ
jgi:tyrosine-protein phosphatase SIW14